VGADEEFAEFYRRSSDGCLRAVLACGIERGLAEEVVAEAYARAYSRWPAVSGHPSPQGWVVRTALNVATSRWRRTRREVSAESLPQGTAPPVAAAAEGRLPDPELAQQLAKLPPRQRQVIALRILLDLDTAATASALGIAESTVGVHLHRALSTLRARMVAAADERSSR